MKLAAQLNYFIDMETRPRVFTYKPSEAEKALMPRYALQDVSIQDAREQPAAFELDTHGFSLLPVASRVSDFYDAEEVRRVYYPEVEGWVAKLTGASRVMAFDHNVRCAEMAMEGRNAAQMPVLSPHNDYTDRSAPQRVRDLMGEEADALLAGRFAVINVWKPIRGPVEAHPLALCDATSIEDGDLVETDLVYHDRLGAVQLLRHRPDQRWFYFSRMQPDEALFMKCFDSARDGRARFTAHTAFEDPTTSDGAPPRESIEVRTLAFFPQAR